MMEKEAGSRTLLLSVIMSALGLIVVGLGLLAERSSAEIAGFVRRGTELLAIAAAFIIYRMTNQTEGVDEARKARLERRSNMLVGWMMCLNSILMVKFLSFGGSPEKGNIVPVLIITALGMIVNTIFWFQYTKLSRTGGNAILTMQVMLYRAKALADVCKTTVLLAVLLFPLAKITSTLDFVVSGIAALYWVWCGLKTVRGNGHVADEDETDEDETDKDETV